MPSKFYDDLLGPYSNNQLLVSVLGELDVGVENVNGLLKVAGESFFVDGSGGEQAMHPRLRRCGWGWVRYDSRCEASEEPLTSMCGNLPGAKETSGRAEMFAVIQVLARTQRHMIICSDCAYVIKGICHGFDHWLLAKFTDL